MADTPTEKEAPTLVDEARIQADRLEKLNAELNLNIKRLEEIQTRNILGGRATAGQEPQKPKELSPQEYAKAALEGKIPLKK